MTQHPSPLPFDYQDKLARLHCTHRPDSKGRKGFCMKDGSVAVVGPFDLDKTLVYFTVASVAALSGMSFRRS